MDIRIFCLLVDFICTGEIHEEKLNHLYGEICRLNLSKNEESFLAWLGGCFGYYGNELLRTNLPVWGGNPKLFYQHHEAIVSPPIKGHLIYFMNVQRTDPLVQKVCMGSILLSSRMDEYNYHIGSDTYLYQMAYTYFERNTLVSAGSVVTQETIDRMNLYVVDEVINYYEDECETVTFDLDYHQYNPFPRYTLDIVNHPLLYEVDTPYVEGPLLDRVNDQLVGGPLLYEDDGQHVVDLYIKTRGMYIMDSKIKTICDDLLLLVPQNVAFICKKYVSALDTADMFNFDNGIITDVKTTVLIQIAIHYGITIATYLYGIPNIDLELIRILRDYYGGVGDLARGIQGLHPKIVRDRNDMIRLPYIMAVLLIQAIPRWESVLPQPDPPHNFDDEIRRYTDTSRLLQMKKHAIIQASHFLTTDSIHRIFIESEWLRQHNIPYHGIDPLYLSVPEDELWRLNVDHVGRIRRIIGTEEMNISAAETERTILAETEETETASAEDAKKRILDNIQVAIATKAVGLIEAEEDGMAAEAIREVLPNGRGQKRPKEEQDSPLPFKQYRVVVGDVPSIQQSRRTRSVIPAEGGTRKRKKQTRKKYSRIKKSLKKLPKTRKTR